jgi:hypothetical protein
MSNVIARPTQNVIARLSNLDATSDQFSWEELKKVYLDQVCFRSGYLRYGILGLAVGGAALAHDEAHFSSGGTFVAFFVILFLISGIAHAVMGWWFNLLPHESAFARVQNWAIARASRPGLGARLVSAASRLVMPLLLVGVLVAAALTIPDKSKHEAELRQAVSASIHAMPEKSGGDVLGKASAWILNAAFKDDASASYIDFMGLEYQKFGVFSVVKDNKGQIVSIGAFNQVYVRDLSQTTPRK